MADLGDRRCLSCGARLRRSREDAGVCDPCRRAAPALALDPALWDEPELSAALARLDFGPVFLRVRAETGYSQHRLGELLDLDQSALSKIERGERSLTDAATLIRVTNALGIPVGKLGFRCGVTVEPCVMTPEDGWMWRRDFLEKVTGLTFGATGVDIHRLLALFPQAEPPGTRHVGAADVQTIEQATTEYTRQDYATGAGQVRDVAVAHLRSVLPLLNAQVSADLRPRLMIATARLVLITGYMSFDVTQHEAARRLWMIGLGLTRDSEHPLGRDLTSYLLYDLAQQALHVGRPDEALQLVHIGEAAAVGSPGSHPVSASTACALSGIAARAHAVRGDTRACDLALHQAEEQFASIDPQTSPPWGGYSRHVGLAANQGGVYYALARHERDPVAASRAVTLLRHSADHCGADYARSRALCLADLAGAHALAGDLDTAVSVGHQAVDAVTAVYSPRAYSRLRRLHTVLEPLHSSPGVAELRDRLTTIG